LIRSNVTALGRRQDAAMTAIDAYARRAVPRYTSYPTAPHFRSPFPEATYRGWLAALDRSEPLSLYLHVPFCRQMCWYCGCNMKLAARYRPVADYVDSLLAEIDLLAAALPSRMTVGHLHWGGGTPTALLPADLERAMDRLRARFAIADGAEIAIESDPRTLTAAMTEAIGRLGFTRASFGVQEFDPRVQAAINRVQPPEMVARTVAGLRAAGVASINFDLIYGLPHQTVATLLDTVARSVAMGPDRIALFGYAHVPWVAKNQRMIPAEALPDAAARAEQAARAAEALAAAGYRAIGIDHFALPGDALARAARAGTLRRNFQGYTTDAAAALLGVGATAIGRAPGGYVQNLAETGAWARAVAAGRLPVARGLALTDEDRRRGALIEAIMCTGEAALPPDLADEPELVAMAADGLLTLDAGRLRLTEAGRPLARVVAAVFDSYLGAAAARHSAAV
jgi:oxygen-independent coproporphyrinogen-3 oxidase